VRKFARLVILALLCAAPVMAQDVALTSRDGAFRIDGTLLSYDGEFYRVDTIYGPLTLDGEGVDCDGPGCPDLASFVAEVRFSGTRRIADVLLPALIQAFAERNRLTVLREVIDDTHSTFVLRDADRIRARFTLRATTTAEGFADLIAEEADIALALREPRDTEVAMAREAGSGDLVRGRRARVIALDGIVAIVAVDQPVKSLSLSQLSGVFSGQISTWSALGGAEAEILPLTPAPDTALYEVFQTRVLSPRNAMISPDIQTQANLEDLVDAVADDSFAIGLTTLSEIGNADPLRISGACGFEQVPSVAALRSEDYPLVLPLMMFTPARRLPLYARQFLEFTSSPAADLVIRRSGFVDQSITTSDFTALGDRLAHAITRAGPDVPLSELQRLVAGLRGRDRLSTTFRFEAGTKLDIQSRENIMRLARALETGAFDGKSLLFVGFSDSEGPSEPNMRLSQSRAEKVQDLVRDAADTADFAQIELRSEAFGEALPIACDDTAWGRAVNRRVEVWVN